MESENQEFSKNILSQLEYNSIPPNQLEQEQKQDINSNNSLNKNLASKSILSEIKDNNHQSASSGSSYQSNQVFSQVQEEINSFEQDNQIIEKKQNYSNNQQNQEENIKILDNQDFLIEKNIINTLPMPHLLKKKNYKKKEKKYRKLKKYKKLKILQSNSELIPIQFKEKISKNIKKNYLKYFEYTQSLEHLKLFDWYDAQAIQRSQLPITFFTGACFWFMICAQYFPRRLIFTQKCSETIKELKLKLDKYIPDAIVRLNKQQINSNKEQIIKNNNQDQQFKLGGVIIVHDDQDEHDQNLMSINNIIQTDIPQNEQNEQFALDIQGQNKEIFQTNDQEIILQKENNNQISLSDQIILNITPTPYNDQILDDGVQIEIEPLNNGSYIQIEEQIQKYSQQDQDCIEIKQNKTFQYAETCKEINDFIAEKIQNQYDQKNYILENTKVQIIYETNYTFQDDEYILTMRKFLLDAANNQLDHKSQILQQISDKMPDQQEDKLQIMKNLNLDTLIDINLEQLLMQRDQNEKLISELQDRMEVHCQFEQKIYQASDFDWKDILVDIFVNCENEKQFFLYLEQRQQVQSEIEYQNNLVPQKNTGKVNQTTIEQRLNQEKTSKKQVEKIDPQDIVCKICNDGDYDDDNNILFCDKCNISVHQKCYYLQKFPEGEWICDACKAFGVNGKYIRCPLCTRRGGAVRQTKLSSFNNTIFIQTNPKFYQFCQTCPVLKDKTQQNIYIPPTQQQIQEQLDDDKNEKKLYYDFQYLNDQYSEEELMNEPRAYFIWIHVSCATWLPETYFEEYKNSCVIKGVEQIDKKRFLMTCSICNTKMEGACMQCAQPKCNVSFHVECGRRAGLFMDIRQIDKVYFQMYCEKHTPSKLRRIYEQKERRYKDEISRFVRSIDKYYETYLREVRMQKDQKFKKTKLVSQIQQFQSKKQLKLQEREEKEFLQAFKEYSINQPCRPNIITIQKIYSDPSQIQYAIIDVQTPMDFIHKRELNKDDEIWRKLKFRGYGKDTLYKLYKRLLRTKKKEYKHMFEDFELQRESRLKKLQYQKQRHNQQKKQQYYFKKQFAQLNRQSSQNSNMSLISDNKINQLSDKDNIVTTKITDAFNTSSFQEENPDQLYCICKKPYQVGELMMMCDQCDEWYHFDCVGFIGTADDAELIQYICDNCLNMVLEETRRKFSITKKKYFVQQGQNDNIIKMKNNKRKNNDQDYIEVLQENQLENIEIKKIKKTQNKSKQKFQSSCQKQLTAIERQQQQEREKRMAQRLQNQINIEKNEQSVSQNNHDSNMLEVEDNNGESILIIKQQDCTIQEEKEIKMEEQIIKNELEDQKIEDNDNNEKIQQFQEKQHIQEINDQNIEFNIDQIQLSYTQTENQNILK